ncbi:ABC transporter ATP-binding protein [Brassicibacter mesophilus]|uniref:ABC transporter ATP-binding protein n=1 Tax=Brassicibacter mesophilus TaxID=745119 RepID=UPI003D1A6794
MKIIETKDLTKKFGDFTANGKINFSVEEGEIHAIVGENGAGKTTLMNMLFGLLAPTSGEILVRGKSVRISNPKNAIKLGIGMVHQHFKLVPSFTVYENILLGDELTKGLTINRKKEIDVVDKLIKKYGFDTNPKSKIQDVSIGTQQRVEILKMLYRDVDILILDEPTAVLTPQEVDELIESLKELKKNGKTIIIITHKLGEVKKCSDSVTVIRRGTVVGRVKTAEVSEEELAKMMVGRDVLLRVEKKDKKSGNVVYEVKDISTNDERGVKVLDKVSFKVHSGEILGVAGVEGNGQSELMKVLTGLMVATEGEVKFEGKDITNLWPDKIRKQGIGIIPEDRYKHGLCKTMKISENLIAGYHMQEPFCSKGMLDISGMQDRRQKLVEGFDIRVGSDDGEVGQLSGGNAQKVIIAREMSMNPQVLIASQPTRGVDIGSIEFIHKQIVKIRDEGKAVVLISSELSEIMGLSDRIIVMYKGKIIGEMSAKDATKESLGYLMAGIKEKKGGDDIEE